MYEKNISKHSIITISRKAGIKSISKCGIEKIREILDEKIKTMSERLSAFYCGKTITKKIVLDFLDSDGIHIMN